MTTLLTAAQVLVRTLVEQGVTHVFCVPGESYLAVLDALFEVQDRITLITCRHEAAAANMAEAYGKLTGRPGIAMVTRGPGATHAAIGVHTARQDSTPMILFIGQVARSDRHREAFQEINYEQMFGPIAKWTAEIERPERMAEYVAHAFSIALNGRPGPAVLSLPEDMLVEGSPRVSLPVIKPAYSAPSRADLSHLQSLLTPAHAPLVLVGGSGWSDQGLSDLRQFIEANNLPIATSFRRKALFDNSHPNYVGDLGIGPNPKLAARVKDADVLLVIGSRLSEMTTSGYSLLSAPWSQQKLIHIHPDPAELGKVYQPTLAIAASFDEVAHALTDIQIPAPAWSQSTKTGRADYEAWIKPVTVEEGVNLSQVMAYLDNSLEPNAILTNGAGNFAAWLHRFYQHRQPRTQLAPTSGAMGYGVPAAIAAKILYPQRTVVCVAGDGDFVMSGQELATAAQYGANVIFLVSNNGVYGTIRMHQDREYPGRVSGTELKNPNFADFARAFGCFGARVNTTEEFAEAFKAAQASGLPAVLDLNMSAKFIAPSRTLSDL